jgi:outer membrane receptor protein involved in Fe transport
VLLDGVPLHDGFGAWVTWTRLPAGALGEADVDRGPQGATFGSDALGGVITLSSPRIDRSAGSVGAAVGTLGTAASDAGGSLRRARASVQGAASWFRTDGAIPVEPAARGPVDTPLDAEWVNAFGKAVLEAGGAGRFTASGWGSTDDRGNGTVQQRNQTSGGTMAVAWDRTLAATQMAARVSVSPNAYEQTFTTVSADRSSEFLTSTQFIDVTTTRAVVEAGRAIPRGYLAGRAMLSRASADFTDRRPASTVVMALRDDSEAVAVQAAWTPAGSLTVGAGARGEWRAAPGAGATRDAAVIGSISAAWSARPGWVVRASAASSHRWPTLNELVRDFRAGSVLTVANPDLRPERARSADAALAWTRGRWTASAGLFWTVVDDAIANVTVTSAPIVRQRRNAGQAHAKGVEFDLDLRPAGWARIRASGLLVDSRFRDSAEPALEGKWLPQVPRSSVSLGGDARLWRGVTVTAVWRALSSQFDDDRNTFELAPAYQLDFRVAGRLRAFAWHVTLDNALDNRVEVGRTPLVTLAPPRSIRAGLTWAR